MFRRTWIVFFLCTFGFATEATLFPTTIFQGECASLFVSSSSSLSGGVVSFHKKKFPLYETGLGRSRVLLPTDFGLPEGSYPLTLFVNEKRVPFQKEISLVVSKKSFRKSVVRISAKKKKEGVTSRSSLWEENKIMGKAYRRKTRKQYWKGKFLKPLNKYLRISTPYGARRDYKEAGSEKVIRQWRHKGIDFSAHLGTPIFAPNDGKVVVSKAMQVHGKTIVIDHGQGVVSIFNHLSQRFVRPREFVKKGQCIGRVGNTGLSTGSHLHFGLSVNNVRVDATQWFLQSFD